MSSAFGHKQNVTVKGPKGTLSHVVAEPITAKVEDGQVVVERPNDERTARSLHGLSRLENEPQE